MPRDNKGVNRAQLLDYGEETRIGGTKKVGLIKTIKFLCCVDEEARQP